MMKKSKAKEHEFDKILKRDKGPLQLSRHERQRLASPVETELKLLDRLAKRVIVTTTKAMRAIDKTLKLVAASERRIERLTLASRKDLTKQEDRTFNKTTTLRLARVVSRATEVFGSPRNATAWLQRRNRALKNSTPISLLNTARGTKDVLNILGRIESGVFS